MNFKTESGSFFWTTPIPPQHWHHRYTNDEYLGAIYANLNKLSTKGVMLCVCPTIKNKKNLQDHCCSSFLAPLHTVSSQ